MSAGENTTGVVKRVSVFLNEIECKFVFKEQGKKPLRPFFKY